VVFLPLLLYREAKKCSKGRDLDLKFEAIEEMLYILHLKKGQI
jgi:hypothetical protein